MSSTNVSSYTEWLEKYYEWLEKYYPINADKVPKEEAVLHSLVKWIGLRQKPPKFYANDTNCALCVHYREYAPCGGDNVCNSCPIKLATGYTCDYGDYSSTDDASFKKSPWYHWSINRNPEPMIKALEEALVYERLNKLARKKVAVVKRPKVKYYLAVTYRGFFSRETKVYQCTVSGIPGEDDKWKKETIHHYNRQGFQVLECKVSTDPMEAAIEQL